MAFPTAACGCVREKRRTSLRHSQRLTEAPAMPSLGLEAVCHWKNRPRNQHWRGFQGVVTRSAPLVTTPLAQTNCRRNASKCWRRDRGG